jgi:predicted AAA+ superfamily ATPase
MGRIFENFVVGELKKQKTWNKTIVNMYHFRVSSGQEVDIVLEDRSGNIVGIEVKSSERVIDQDFNGLKFLKERVKDKFIVGIVLYTGQLCSPVDKDLYVLSINSLWDDVWNPV